MLDRILDRIFGDNRAGLALLFSAILAYVVVVIALVLCFAGPVFVAWLVCRALF